MKLNLFNLLKCLTVLNIWNHFRSSSAFLQTGQLYKYGPGFGFGFGYGNQYGPPIYGPPAPQFLPGPFPPFGVAPFPFGGAAPPFFPPPFAFPPAFPPAFGPPPSPIVVPPASAAAISVASLIHALIGRKSCRPIYHPIPIPRPVKVPVPIKVPFPVSAISMEYSRPETPHLEQDLDYEPMEAWQPKHIPIYSESNNFLTKWPPKSSKYL